MISQIQPRSDADTTARDVASTRAKKNVAVLFSRIGPYHHARLKAAGSLLRVTAIEFSNVDTTYAWNVVEGADGFARITLFPTNSADALPGNCISKRINEVLDQSRPQAVAIPGWSERCSLAALRWCGTRCVPAVMMSETTSWDDNRKWWKEAVKRRLVGLCSTGLVGGRAHSDYLEQLGIERGNLFFGYDAVDNGYFATKVAEVRSQGSEARRQHKLPDKFFLASARFVEKKNLPRLIEAYGRYRELVAKAESGNRKAEIWDLVVLGDGPLRSAISNLRSSLGLDACVHLPGFKQYDELPLYYGLAQAFIHASTTEQWGLVVNEAMASGLPVLVSNRCGCAADLVQEGVNGFTFDPQNVGTLADLMCRVSASGFPLSAFGKESERVISTWGSDQFAEGLLQAVETALASPPRRPSLLDRYLLQLLVRK